MVDRISVNSKFVKDIQIGELGVKYSASGDRILRFTVDFRHKILAVHKDVSAPDLGILQNKVDALMASWDRKMQTEMARREIAAGKHQADNATIEASKTLESLDRILAHTLEVDDTVDWDSLKDHSAPPKSTPFLARKPVIQRSRKPITQSPKITICDFLSGNRSKKIAEAERRFGLEFANWTAQEKKNGHAHTIAVKAWESGRAAHDKRQEAAKEAFLERQRTTNERVDELEKAYAEGDASAIIEHASIVLEVSDYGALFEKSYEIEYDQPSRTLLLEYELPSPDVTPTLKSVRFVQSTGEMKESHISERDRKASFTRSSKDGGVDAVAFDPDPISGGKIVIQAKRYTKTVGVAAVRDLYGTTLNEGANKGILVTTADYGPDAYKFASDKPMTLMTGANLLHLLERHGMKAKIDLQAAREARLSS